MGRLERKEPLAPFPGNTVSVEIHHIYKIVSSVITGIVSIVD
jgi:hypothetical protein